MTTVSTSYRNPRPLPIERNSRAKTLSSAQREKTLSVIADDSTTRMIPTAQAKRLPTAVLTPTRKIVASAFEVFVKGAPSPSNAHSAPSAVPEDGLTMEQALAECTPARPYSDFDTIEEFLLYSFLCLETTDERKHFFNEFLAQAKEALDAGKPIPQELLNMLGVAADHDGFDFDLPAEFVKLWLAKNPNLAKALHIKTSCGDTLLHTIAAYDDIVTARFLLEQGLRPDAKNSLGTTPIMIAETSEDEETAMTQLLRKPLQDMPPPPFVCEDTWTAKAMEPLRVEQESNAKNALLCAFLLLLIFACVFGCDILL
jgi:hypothetical protein